MPKGRRPLPTNVKAARGNPGKRRLNANEPQFAAAPDLSPPSMLTGEARRIWLDTIGGLHANGLATIPFLHVLAQYCIARAEWMAAEAKIKREGVIVNTRLGRSINPRCKVRDDAHKRMLEAQRELGFTPAASSKIKASPPPGAAPQDDFTKMRNEGRDVVAKIG